MTVIRRVWVFCAASLVVLNLAPRLAAGQAMANPGRPFAPYEGVYRLPSGEQIVVSRMGVIDEVARPYFLDWQTGRYGFLAAGGSDRFTSTASIADKPGAPPRTDIQFGRGPDGRVDSLTIGENGQAARKAVRVELYVDRNVVFHNRDVALAATLRMPATRGTVPAVVLVHGSGPGERTQVSVMNTFFASLGLAVLTYDKRGCGGSGGDWKAVDLDVLADDALAGVRWLKAQAGIDPARVGIWGISQGGWVGPLAGSQDGQVAFVINSSGPATSLRRQDTFMMANTLKSLGVEAQDVALVVQGLNLLYDYGQGKTSAAAVDAVMDQVRAHPVLKELGLPPAASLSPSDLYAKQKIGDPAWFFHLNPDNDAVTPYRRLRCPVLVTYGRLDYTVPVEDSVTLLEAVAAGSQPRTLSVEVIPDSGHGYLQMQAARPSLPVSPTVISRVYFDVIERWLRANVLTAARGSAREDGRRPQHHDKRLHATPPA